MNTTEIEAFQAMLSHHASLEEDLGLRVDALVAAVNSGHSFEPWAADLVAFMAADVFPHAIAEEKSIYCAAATMSDLAATVEEMIGEHGGLATAVDELVRVSDGREAVRLAREILASFTQHVSKENDLILPRLLADPKVNLVHLLGQMHDLLGPLGGDSNSDQDESIADEIARSADPTSELLKLLLGATKALAAQGQGDLACKFAASSWVALRQPRPDLASKVTAALHQLVHSATSEPVTLISAASRATATREGFAADKDSMSTSRDSILDGSEFDVRQLSPTKRHETIFATYEALAAHTSFVLVNDHDPKPLRYQFEAEHTGEFSWDYLESGPKVWRVRIGRLALKHNMTS